MQLYVSKHTFPLGQNTFKQWNNYFELAESHKYFEKLHGIKQPLLKEWVMIYRKQYTLERFYQEFNLKAVIIKVIKCENKDNISLEHQVNT
jgi:hypothetical protein